MIFDAEVLHQTFADQPMLLEDLEQLGRTWADRAGIVGPSELPETWGKIHRLAAQLLEQIEALPSVHAVYVRPHLPAVREIAKHASNAGHRPTGSDERALFVRRGLAPIFEKHTGLNPSAWFSDATGESRFVAFANAVLPAFGFSRASYKTLQRYMGTNYSEFDPRDCP